ncbi:glycosyltransferase [Ammoniphilus sp. 3BR4]|uniref:glycosyltransferase n=1 Tax=Ammoniphilus sp. 3BR4 TaxID=3158265 RepID=UPI003466B2EC
MEIDFNTWKIRGANSGQQFTKPWIENRISIFMNFTLNSLKNQTNQNFLALIRYADQTEGLVKQALKKYPGLPANIKFAKLSNHMQISLEYIQGSEFTYIVRLDSDDMYHLSFIQQLHDYKPKEGTKVLINQKGYMYNSLNYSLSTYTRSSPPFYTLIYKTEDYLQGIRYRIKGHANAIRLRHEILKPRNFIVVIHNGNSLSTFVKEKMVTNPLEVKRILQQFMGGNIPAPPKRPNFKRRVNSTHWTANGMPPNNTSQGDSQMFKLNRNDPKKDNR